MKFRVRSSGALVTASPTYERTACNDTVTSGVSANSDGRFSNGAINTMTDVVTPNFAKRSAAGEVIVTPMTKRDIVITSYFGPSTVSRNSSCTGTGLKHQTWQCYSASKFPVINIDGMFTSVVDPVIDSLVKEAITDAEAKISTPPLQMLVEAAEAKKTIASLANSAEDFRSFVFQQKASKAYQEWIAHELDVTTGRRTGEYGEALKEKRVRDALQRNWGLQRFIASRWLQLRYTVTPLALSASAAMKLYKDKGLTRPDRQTVRAFKYVTSESSFSAPVGVAGSYFTGSVDTTVKRRIEVRAGAIYDQRKAKPLGVGTQFSDIPASGWELLPFSFIVDWFANVGSYLYVQFPLVGVRKLASWVTVTETVEISSVENISSAGVAGYTATPGSSSVTILAVQKTRIVNPETGLSLRRSTLNLGTQIQRGVDAAALAVSLLGNKNPLLR